MYSNIYFFQISTMIVVYLNGKGSSNWLWFTLVYTVLFPFFCDRSIKYCWRKHFSLLYIKCANMVELWPLALCCCYSITATSLIPWCWRPSSCSARWHLALIWGICMLSVVLIIIIFEGQNFVKKGRSTWPPTNIEHEDIIRFCNPFVLYLYIGKGWLNSLTMM